MYRTRSKKIIRDILASRGRSILVVLSIFIGVFGVTTMMSITDIINRQLNSDINPDNISHTHIYVSSTGVQQTLEDNQVILNSLRGREGITDVEGQAVYPVDWRLAEDDDFESGFMVAFTEGFTDANLEPVMCSIKGRYPIADAHEIAVEQRFADAHDVAVGDQLRFRTADGNASAWTVVGLVLHPYFTIAPAIQDQIPSDMAVYAYYADAQEIVGFQGLSAIHLRYIDTATAEHDLDQLIDFITEETPYVVTFTFLDDPNDNFLSNIIKQVNSTLNMLGMLAMIVSGFLVTNVMNTVIVEQRRQIGIMQAIGANMPDVVLIYTGIVLTYGILGTLFGVLVAIPVASVLARQIGLLAFTYIDGWRLSPLGIGIGFLIGLLVPMIAAAFPVFNGMRISILEAMIDLGISSNWGQTRLSRWISSLPFPTPIVQAISNIYQKKGRLALTALALTLAVATFMGVTAMANSLESLVDRLHEAYGYQIAITPQDPLQAHSLVADLKASLPSDGIYMGYNVSIGIEGFRSANPLAEGSNQLTATGIDPTEHAIVFDLVEGEGWQNDHTRRGVIVSQTLANNMNESLGDSLNLVIGGQTTTYPIIGIDNYGFDALYINWRDLAIASGHVDENGQPLAGIYYVNLADQNATIETVDDEIDIIANQLQANGIQAAYNNQLRVIDNQSQQINLFGVVFNATSLIMAAVGAIGLAASLSMNVFERQKEIGVMRSIGAGSLSIISQFLLEGVLVGILAWLVAIPLSIVLEFSLLATLPFDYVEFAYPPQILAYGLVGVAVIAALASLWPSVMASRKTVSEILRYR